MSRDALGLFLAEIVAAAADFDGEHVGCSLGEFFEDIDMARKVRRG
ncbi:hypothetical protein [Nocardia sp. CA-135398]